MATVIKRKVDRRSTRQDTRFIWFVAEFIGRPEHEEIAEVQKAMGFSPKVYGEPKNVVMHRKEVDWIVRWSCEPNAKKASDGTDSQG